MESEVKITETKRLLMLRDLDRVLSILSELVEIEEKIKNYNHKRKKQLWDASLLIIHTRKILLGKPIRLKTWKYQK